MTGKREKVYTTFGGNRPINKDKAWLLLTFQELSAYGKCYTWRRHYGDSARDESDGGGMNYCLFKIGLSVASWVENL